MRGFQWTFHEWEFSLAGLLVGALLTFFIMDFRTNHRFSLDPILVPPVICGGIIAGKAWYFLSAIGWAQIVFWLFIVAIVVLSVYLMLSNITIGDPNSQEGARHLFAPRTRRPVQDSNQDQAVYDGTTTNIGIDNLGIDNSGGQEYERPSTMYHGTPTWAAACDIYLNNRWKSSTGYSICITPDFRFATGYSGIDGFLVELFVSPQAELEFTGGVEYQAPIPNGVPGKYYEFTGITPMRILDFHQRDVTPR